VGVTGSGTVIGIRSFYEALEHVKWALAKGERQ